MSLKKEVVLIEYAGKCQELEKELFGDFNSIAAL